MTTAVMPHPNAQALVVAVPRRFVVVDGNVYWLDGRTLMHAPLNAAGQIAWSDGGPVEAVSNEVADMIAERLQTTFTLIDIAQQEA